jgi:hypothetical protein
MARAHARPVRVLLPQVRWGAACESGQPEAYRPSRGRLPDLTRTRRPRAWSPTLSCPGPPQEPGHAPGRRLFLRLDAVSLRTCPRRPHGQEEALRQEFGGQQNPGRCQLGALTAAPPPVPGSPSFQRTRSKERGRAGGTAPCNPCVSSSPAPFARRIRPTARAAAGSRAPLWVSGSWSACWSMTRNRNSRRSLADSDPLPLARREVGTGDDYSCRLGC